MEYKHKYPFGRIEVLYGSKCVCTPKGSKEPVSITWCYCCKGHVHTLLEVALGQKLTGKVLCSSCSGGENCQFEFEINSL
ncbi:hypothetical protein LLG10_05255 [bacterium]|nr:hypothetical protein [bacterium]